MATEITADASADACVASALMPSPALNDVALIAVPLIAQDVETVNVPSVEDDAGLPAVHFFTTTVVLAAGDTLHITFGVVLAGIATAMGIG